MTEPLQLVIFDCDGVLVDSERLAVRVEAAVLAELGWPLSQAEVIERFMGRSQAFMAQAILDRLGDRLPGDWQDRLDRRAGWRARGRCCSTTCAGSPTCSPAGSQRRTRCATMPVDLARPATATRRTRPWRR